MILNTKFGPVVLSKKNMFLTYKKTKKREIEISELDKIYIKIYKSSRFHCFIFICLSLNFFLFTLLLLSPTSTEIILLLFILIITNTALIKHKICRLSVHFKNGSIYKKQIPLNLKFEAVQIVAEVRAEIKRYKTKNRATQIIFKQNFEELSLQELETKLIR